MIAVWLVALAGTVIAIAAYEVGRVSGDGQEALVLPFVVFWTVVALVVVWALDRATAGRVDSTPSLPVPCEAGR